MKKSIPALACLIGLTACAPKSNVEQSREALAPCLAVADKNIQLAQLAESQARNPKYAAESSANSEICGEARRKLARIDSLHPCILVALNLESHATTLATSFGTGSLITPTLSPPTAEEVIACEAATGASLS